MAHAVRGDVGQFTFAMCDVPSQQCGIWMDSVLMVKVG
jgi:hypothetical protein